MSKTIDAKHNEYLPVVWQIDKNGKEHKTSIPGI